MTDTTPEDSLEASDRADQVTVEVPPRRRPVFEPAQDSEPRPADGPEPEPYPAAARPSFDIPVSAPVSAHAPVVLERISAPAGTSLAKATRTGEDAETDGGHAAAGRDGRRSTNRASDTPASGAHSSTTGRPSARARRAAIVALSVLLVLALGGSAYLAVLANECEQRSSEWEAQSRDLGSEVADLTGDVAGMTSELTIVRDQLATAQTRITELADEKAQVGDDRESQKILADDVLEVAETALDVSAALGDCVTAQNTVIGYLAAPETVTPEVLQTAITQADTVCTAAVADYNSLQQDLEDP